MKVGDEIELFVRQNGTRTINKIVGRYLGGELLDEGDEDLDWALLRIVSGNPGRSVDFSEEEEGVGTIYSYNCNTKETKELHETFGPLSHRIDTWEGTSSALLWSNRTQKPVGWHNSGIEQNGVNYYTPWRIVKNKITKLIEDDQRKNRSSPSSSSSA